MVIGERFEVDRALRELEDRLLLLIIGLDYHYNNKSIYQFGE